MTNNVESDLGYGGCNNKYVIRNFLKVKLRVHIFKFTDRITSYIRTQVLTKVEFLQYFLIEFMCMCAG